MPIVISMHRVEPGVGKPGAAPGLRSQDGSGYGSHCAIIRRVAEPPIARIRLMQQRAEADLLAAAGDASLCVLAKSGQSFPAVKYHEGRAAVLSALLRSPMATDGDLIESLNQQRRRLRGLARLAERDAEWEGYIQGGLDTLDRVELLV